MTRVTTCDECGERERTGFQRDGVCRDCRGVTTGSKTPAGVRTYVSPDDIEARGEELDYAEMEARERTIENTRTRE